MFPRCGIPSNNGMLHVIPNLVSHFKFGARYVVSCKVQNRFLHKKTTHRYFLHLEHGGKPPEKMVNTSEEWRRMNPRAGWLAVSIGYPTYSLFGRNWRNLGAMQLRWLSS